MKSAPRLKLIATTWTLTQYPTPKQPWSPARQVHEILAAGFEGVQTRYDNPIIPHARAAGLEIVGGSDFGSVAGVEPRLRAFQEVGVVHVNCQVADHDTPTAKALPIVRKIIDVGDRLGMKPAIEVHRDTCTETPEKAYALADAYRRATKRPLRMNFDHSHPAIVKHLAPPYWDRLGERLDLLRLGELIHFRPFNGHHCQIPITNGKGRFSPEFEAWLPFCEATLAAWLKGARGRTLYAVPELGPRAGGYCLSAFPDVWKDKLVVAREIRKAWNRALRKARQEGSR